MAARSGDPSLFSMRNTTSREKLAIMEAPSFFSELLHIHRGLPHFMNNLSLMQTAGAHGNTWNAILGCMEFQGPWWQLCTAKNSRCSVEME